jgi:hypothetical protein
MVWTARVGFDIRFDGGIGTMEILGDIVGPIGDIADWEAAQDPEPEKKTNSAASPQASHRAWPGPRFLFQEAALYPWTEVPGLYGPIPVKSPAANASRNTSTALLSQPLLPS